MLSTWHSDDSTVARWTHAVARVRFNIPAAWAIGLVALLIVPSFAVWGDPVEDAQPSAGDLQQRLRGAAASLWATTVMEAETVATMVRSHAITLSAGSGGR